MASGDGLLVRVKPRGGVLTLSAARTLAAAAARWGNGVIEATGRAALQVRGLSEASAEAFASAMMAAGLGGADPGVERRRNVIASPLAGDDPAASRHAAPVAAALEAALAAEGQLGALPPKFGFLVDGGGVLGLAGVAADVTLRLSDERCAIAADGSTLAAVVGVAQAAQAGVRLAHAFLGLTERATPPPRRMRTLVETVGADAVFAAAGLAAVPSAIPAHPRRASVGWLPYVGGERGAFGLGLSFGTITPPALLALADAAERVGDGSLRVTPWRALVVAGVGSRTGAEALQDAGTRLGLITDPADPRLAVAACPGRPACASATVDTRATAAALAALGLPGAIHVSGCAKGCAHPGPAAITLVGDGEGRYGLVRHGRAADAPTERGLTAGEAVALIQRERAAA